MTDNFELGLSSIPLVSPVLLDRSGSPITGSSTIVVEIRRFGTSDRWDFNDNTFKTSGWTTRQGALTEVSASLDPGIYERAAGWVATSVVAGFYIITYRDTASSALPAIEAVRLGGPADTIATKVDVVLSTRASATALATAQGNITSILAFGAPPTAAAVSAQVVDQALSGHTTAGTVGEALSRCDVATSTRLATSSYSAAPSASTVAAAVVDQALAGHTTAGTAGAALSRCDTATSALATDLTAIKGAGFTAGVDDLHAAHADRFALAGGIAAVQADTDDLQTRTPAALVDGRTPAYVGAMSAAVISQVQLGLATRATSCFDVEIVTTSSGEQVYFPYYKGGAPVLGATLSMSVSRIGIVMVEGVPTEVFETLDFSEENFVAPADNTYPAITMDALDATYPGVYVQHFSQEFPANAVTPDIYTVWIYDGAELVGMGRMRIGMADTIAALPAAITSARDHVETAVATGFTEIKGVDFDTATDSLRAMRVRGDEAWLTANISGLATSQNVLDAVTAIEGYGDTRWLTATGFATSVNVTDARDHVEAYGAAHWNTATGFAVPGSAMTLADAALLPAKIGAGFVAAMQANLALEGTLTAMKGASFDSATDSLRATRVLVSALPTTAAPTADAIVTAVWATEADGSEGTALGKLTLLHDRQTGRRKMGNDGYELIYARDNVTVIKKTLVKDINGDIVIPGAGDPSDVSEEMDP